MSASLCTRAGQCDLHHVCLLLCLGPSGPLRPTARAGCSADCMIGFFTLVSGETASRYHWSSLGTLPRACGARPHSRLGASVPPLIELSLCTFACSSPSFSVRAVMMLCACSRRTVLARTCLMTRSSYAALESPSFTRATKAPNTCSLVLRGRCFLDDLCSRERHDLLRSYKHCLLILGDLQIQRKDLRA